MWTRLIEGQSTLIRYLVKHFAIDTTGSRYDLSARGDELLRDGDSRIEQAARVVPKVEHQGLEFRFRRVLT